MGAVGDDRGSSSRRARIVLLAAEGCNRDIGGMVDLHYNQVGVWRKRYGEFGLAGLDDEERSGRPFVYDHDDVLLLVKTVTEPPPDEATRWTMEALAEAMAAHGVPISASQVWRICRGLDLKPWQVESLDDQPRPRLLGESRRRVRPVPRTRPTTPWCGRWTRRPLSRPRARVGPTRPAVPGHAGRQEFEYGRNGTAVLFAGWTCMTAGWPAGSPTRPARTTSSRSSGTSSTRPRPAWTCTASWTTSRPIRPQVADLLGAQPQVHLHFTPTHASWLNQVELFFSILERRLLRRGEFNSVDDLADGSSPSSRTTTAGRHHSAGPTRAAPSRSRKSQ